MIKIGIIGLGNVGLSVHLPILLARSDLKISWVYDPNNKVKKICDKKKIPFFSKLNDALKYDHPEIVLITTPYYSRKEIFKKLGNKISGIYCEKPFALTLKEHLNYAKNFKNYAFTIGYQRRSLGIVQTAKKILSSNLFGDLNNLIIEFGDVHYNYDNFRSDKSKAGGGIFFETGSHWIDAAIYILNAKKIDNFSCDKKIENDLDVHSQGSFNIYNYSDKKIKCSFKFSSIENTKNKIIFKFNNCSIELFLFDDNSNLTINGNNSERFPIEDISMKNFPNDSLSQGACYWDKFISSYKKKESSYTSLDTFLLTTEAIELFYGN